MDNRKPLRKISETRDFNDRIEIRGATQDDRLDEMREWMRSVDYAQVIGQASRQVSDGDIDDFLLNRTQGAADYCFSVISSEDRMVRGFYYVAFDRRNRIAHLSCSFMPGERARWLAWRTIDAFLNYLFDHQDTYKVVARISVRNRKMLFAFLANTRFYKEAVLRNEILLSNGQRSDVIVYAATSDMPREPAY